jgi:phosphatidylinositol alpha-1,6-mannosyltransferase
MEKLNWHMVDAIARAADTWIVGPVGAAVEAPSSVGAKEAPLKPLPLFLCIAFFQAMICAWRYKPDIVLAGSGVTAPLAWLVARMHGAKAVVYVHGLDVAVRHWLYRLVWVPALRRMDRVIANSQVSAGLAAQLRISRKRMLVVHPGADPGEASAWAGRDTAMRAELSIGEGPLLLSVGRLTERKGLREFVTDALPSIVASFPRCTLIVVGDAPSHSLYAKSQSRESIQAAADNAGVGQRLRFLGVISDQRKLARIYRAADLHVFPVRELPGDPEGFGMVAIEAASFGVPTVAYASGGIVESVRDGESGTLVTPGDAAAFASAVVDTLERLDASVRRRTMEYAADFAWPRFDERFRRAVLDGWLNG